VVHRVGRCVSQVRLRCHLQRRTRATNCIRVAEPHSNYCKVHAPVRQAELYELKYKRKLLDWNEIFGWCIVVALVGSLLLWVRYG